MRTKGSKNIIPFGSRTDIETSSAADISHIANIQGTPLEVFQQLLNHQANFLVWLDERHEVIVDLKKQIFGLQQSGGGKGPTGAKLKTFVKYRWYADQLVLLDAINAFEVFYKQTLVRLGTALAPYVQINDDRVLRIPARELWALVGRNVAPSAIPSIAFEQDLFHDLDNVDKATAQLVGQRRYNKNATPNPLAARVKALNGIFQIRHTLSHNAGLVTAGDKTKFDALGWNVAVQEIIDPVKDKLGISIFKELEAEAAEFTGWLAMQTSRFLTNCIQVRNLQVPIAKRQELEAILGSQNAWTGVPWN